MADGSGNNRVEVLMVDIYSDECAAVGLDEKKVSRIANRISRAGRDADKLGLKVFGGSGQGTLRAYHKDRERWLIVASLQGNFDGGDGGCTEIDGLCSGE